MQSVRQADGLIIIVGAGASHDCFVPTTTEFIDRDWRPPLTSGIFSKQKNFQTILNQYPVTLGAISSYIADGGPNKISVEDFLKELTSQKDLIRRRQANYITLYLQKLFFQISHLYLADENRTAISAYSILIQKLYESMESKKISSISIISLNYDFILERAIEAQFGPSFRNIENYCNFKENWNLIKYHGSANWWHPYDPQKTHQPNHHSNALQRRFRAIEEGTISPETLMKSIPIRVGHTDNENQNPNEPVYFPAMAIPVAGKYGAVCPDNHIETLKNILGRGKWRLLVLGFSAKDKDVLEDIAAYWPSMTRFLTVNESKQSGLETINYFKKSDIRFNRPLAYVYDNGFSHFVRDDNGLKHFLS